MPHAASSSDLTRSPDRAARSGLRHAARTAWAAGAVLAVYVGMEWASFIHDYKGIPITPWHPGLGVIFGLMIVRGPVAGLLLLAGAVAAEIMVLDTVLDLPIVVAAGLLMASSYAGIAALARRALKLDVAVTHLRDVLILLGAGLAGALASAFLLTSLLILWGHLGLDDYRTVAFPLFIGDVIGIAVVTPLVLRFVFLPRPHSTAEMLAAVPDAILYGSLSAAALVMIWGAGPEGQTAFYLLFVPVVAAALRRGLDGACLSLAAIQSGLVAILRLRGYDAAVFTEFQILMLVLTSTGLIVGVVVNERRNADRLAKEAEERLKRKEAEAAQAARFNLVTGMASALAHEINQPMTAARALARSAEHILEAGGDLARARANLTTLIAHIDHAGEVLQHVRDFLRRGSPGLRSVDLRTMLEEAMILIRSSTATRRIAVRFDIPPVLPAVRGDQVQLQQVLLNLVHNASEAIGARGGGRIDIVARRQDEPERVEVSVVDNGPGVPPEMVATLFNPLTTSKHEGLGLGLSICDSILTTHGGRIWLQSSAPGRTEFRFSLPVTPPTEHRR